MKLKYSVQVLSAENHLVQVSILGKIPARPIEFFLPVWSPGSYLVREYSRHLRDIRLLSSKGEPLYIEQSRKNRWRFEPQHPEFKTKAEEFELIYTMYLHELTVRTSHVDAHHAFLHGPSYLMGVVDEKLEDIQLELRFPPAWSHVSTALEDVAKKRDEFLYFAKDYDVLLDCPIEIGCQDTDGFYVEKVPHELATVGECYFRPSHFKSDIEKIVTYIAGYMGGDLPYKKYCFIMHFFPNLYGGLEHQSSCALQFDGRLLAHRATYLNWLGLVSHEYFHLWNIKRIRPKELGPFDYENENYTRMLWLAEGLTSYVEDLFVYQADLCTLQEYLDNLANLFKRYFQAFGRKFHSLEDSSFNAWIKLYRPDEFTANSTISYYVKGALCFLALHLKLHQSKKSLQQFIQKLWAQYLDRPAQGLGKEEFLKLLKEYSSEEIVQYFDDLVINTQEIDFEVLLKDVGVRMVWEESVGASLGIQTKVQEGKIIISQVDLDGAAYQDGLNAGDELLAINRQRLNPNDLKELTKMLRLDGQYLVMVSRSGIIREIEVAPKAAPKMFTRFQVENTALAQAFFKEKL